MPLKTDARQQDERTMLLAEQVPSLITLYRKVRAERPLATDDFAQAVATLCQSAYEDRYDWVLSKDKHPALVEPINPAEHRATMVGLAAAYLADAAK